MSPVVRLRVRIAVIVAAGALLVAAGVAQLLNNTVQLRTNAREAISTDAYLLAVVDVERRVVDAETGLRGYLVTGREQFLQPLARSRVLLPVAEANLRAAAARAGVFQAQAAELSTAATHYLTGYVAHQLRLARRNLKAARSVATTGLGKRQVDAIRVMTGRLERAVEAQQVMHGSAARQTANHSIEEAVVLLVLLTGLTLLLGSYLGHLAVQRENARQRAASTTRTLQQSILPARLPSIPGCELAIRFLPAGGELVGGDFYDAYELAPGVWMLVLGDVCGKGASAAAVSAMARWTLRSLSRTERDPAQIVRSLNEQMLQEAADVPFVTLMLALVTLEPSSASVTVVCAGHPQPVLVPAGGTATLVQATGDLVGIWPDFKVSPVKVRLAPGDAIVAYTDGVSDQGPGQRHVAERALRERDPSATAEELADRVERAADRVWAGQRDDIAVVALRVDPGAGASEAERGNALSAAASPG